MLSYAIKKRRFANSHLLGCCTHLICNKNNTWVVLIACNFLMQKYCNCPT